MNYLKKYRKYKKKYLKLKTQYGGVESKNYKILDQYLNDKTNPFILNHYKFKSDEEYDLRTIEYDKDGPNKNKLSQPIYNKNGEIRTEANSVTNTEILEYLRELKNQISGNLIQIPKKEIYNISIVAMFRYENDYLNEWLNYYIIHGVEHFFLYSHKNNDLTFKILKPYIDKGYITLINWNDDEILKVPEHKRRLQDGSIVGWHTIGLQNLALIDFTKKYKQKTKWIISVDIDEYIYPLDTKKKIKDILDNSKDIKQYYIGGILFGSNGHEKKPNGLIIENYTKCSNKPKGSDYHKSITLTEYISEKYNGYIHHFDVI